MANARLIPVILAAGLAFCSTARAAVISSSPSLPPLGVGFGVSGAGTCFNAAGVCAIPGVLTFTSVVASPPAPPAFNSSGQDIRVNATLTAELTTLSNVPIGSLVLTGTVEEEVLGRTFSTQTGSWSVELLAVELSGPVLGHTLSLQLDSATPSIGMASVEAIAGSDLFRIDSFFDVFVDLTLDGPIPLHATRAAHLALLPAAIPEPASLTLLAGAVLGLATMGRRRRAH